MSISKGTQIYIGQLVGAGKLEKAYHQLFKSLKYALILATVAAIMFAIFGRSLFQLFTDDTDIIYTDSFIDWFNFRAWKNLQSHYNERT